MPRPRPQFYTAEMVNALNAANPKWWPRYETLYGELLVTSAPRDVHQWMCGELLVALHAYLEREPVGVVFMAPADIRWGRRDVLVQPDVFVVPMDVYRRPLPAGATTRGWDAIDRLLLAAEVISPSTARRDRFGKRLLQQRQGTPAYWVIDLDRREAEVWTPEADLPVVERERLVWHPDGAREPFTFDLAARLAAMDELFG